MKAKSVVRRLKYSSFNKSTKKIRVDETKRNFSYNKFERLANQASRSFYNDFPETAY